MMKRKILLFMMAWFIASLSFGQLLIEKFNQVTPDTSINLPGWKNIAQTGTELFQGKYDSADSNYFAQITATGSGELSNVSWLITPTYYVSPGNALNFRSKSGFTNADVFSLWISTNFTGNYSTATWTELSFVEPTDDGSSFGNWQNSGYISLEAYAGSNITIAFKYTGGDPAATTVWQIDDVVITNKPFAVVSPASLSFTVASGSSASGAFTLSNFGGGTLNYDQNSKSFSKANYSDWNLPSNQLRLLPDIWITRKNSQGIFNIAQEPGYSYDPSPAGTLWAYGLTKNLKPEDYDVWAEAVNYDPPEQVGNPISMNIIGTSIYYDIVFQSWTESANGGGFSLNYSIYQPEWLVISTHSGNINQGNSVNVNVTIDATNLYQGTYHTQVAFYTNDPNKPVIFIPIEVIVTGEPNIFSNINTYNFGDVFVNGTKTYQLEVINSGRDTLMIDNVSSNNTVFSFDDTTFQILPDTSYLLSLHFAPLALQAYNGILSIHNNDPDQNILNITLNGQGVAPPEFSLTPDSFYVSVHGCNIVENRITTISNSGGNNLNWEILPGLGIPCNKSILVIQDKDEWNVWMNTFIENEFGITPDLIGYSQISTTNFMNYDIIVTCGDQSSDYYDAITNNRSKFEAFANAGGVVQYQLATQGDDVTIISVINFCV